MILRLQMAGSVWAFGAVVLAAVVIQILVTVQCVYQVIGYMIVTDDLTILYVLAMVFTEIVAVELILRREFSAMIQFVMQVQRYMEVAAVQKLLITTLLVVAGQRLPVLRHTAVPIAVARR